MISVTQKPFDLKNELLSTNTSTLNIQINKRFLRQYISKLGKKFGVELLLNSVKIFMKISENKIWQLVLFSRFKIQRNLNFLGCWFVAIKQLSCYVFLHSSLCPFINLSLSLSLSLFNTFFVVHTFYLILDHFI